MTAALSVVIASTEGTGCLDLCLQALACQTYDGDYEVVIATSSGEAVSRFVNESYPHVRVISVEESASIPELRSIAIEQSEGKIIVLTEDHCIPPNDWLQRIADLHSSNASAAIGGYLQNGAHDRLLDWAVFYTEYGRFLPGEKDGPVTALPGPNVSYKREALAGLAIKPSFWDWSVHEALSQSGQTLWNDSQLGMVHSMHYTLGQYLLERYEYSLNLAKMRVGREGKLLFRLLTVPCLPAVILLRAARTVAARPTHLARFFACAPYLVLFALVWTWGEFVGYLSYRAPSLQRGGYDFDG